MNFNEKIIPKLVGIFTLIFGLSIIFFDIKSGYRLSVLYLIPSIFVAVGLFAIFNESILRWLNKIMTKEIFEKNTKFIFFIFPLSIFSIIGFLMMFFAFKLNWDVDLLGWSTISIFAFFPLIMIYGLVFGFSIPEKRQRLIQEGQEKRREKLFSNDKGITIEMPLFDKNCFISWPSIEAIIYYN